MATTRRPIGVRYGLAVGLAVVAWLSARPAAHIPIGTSVTWNRDVIGILERRCLACHREDGPAPMALTSYDMARPWVRAIREEVLERRMPPTALRSGANLYENARALSPAEIELLVSWADGGAPRGTGDESRETVHQAVHLGPAIPGRPAASDAASLRRTLRVSLPSGWIDAWTVEPGTWPALSAMLRLADRRVIGDWAVGDPAVQYPAGVGLRIPTAAGVILEVTLARPLTVSTAAQPPSLRIRRSKTALRPVARRTMQQSASATRGEQLLALSLGLRDPSASAHVFVARHTGQEEFLLTMAPPGAGQTMTVRLRAPLPLDAGDRVQVRSTSGFSLALESVIDGAEPANHRPVAGSTSTRKGSVTTAPLR